MALISNDKKFIFFHLYKCGGMSLRKLIDQSNIDTFEYQGGHSCPNDLITDYKNKGLENELNEYFKFTFIRNPFDFMVSTYFYAKSYTNHFMHNDIVNGNMSMLEFTPYYFTIREKHMDNTIRPLGSNKVVTLKDWIAPEGNIIVDFVGKIENYSNDLKIICERIGVDFESLPNKNVNPHRSVDYRSYYTTESIKIIEEKFEWELNKFNYNF